MLDVLSYFNAFPSTIAGRADGGKYPSAALKGENGWTEASGCPLYTNDDFPLSVQQMEDIFAKHPNLTAFVPTGGFPQFVSKAFRRVTIGRAHV